MMLCEKITPEEAFALPDFWKCNFKFDGERIMAFIHNGCVELRNRRGNIKNTNYTEIVEDLMKLGNYENCILDGEVISEDNDFNKLQQRALTKDKFRQDILRKEVPVKYVIFDIIKSGDRDLTCLSLEDRYNLLSDLLSVEKFKHLEKVEFMEISVGFHIALSKQMEGIVVKNMTSGYESRRSSYWRKCKFFHEDTMVAIRYTENPKGIRVEDEKGNAVQVAGSESRKVKEKIDKDGSCLIEIQYLTKSNEGAMRFPSFRGIK